MVARTERKKKRRVWPSSNRLVVSSPTLREFNGIAVRIVGLHGSLPRHVLRGTMKVNASRLELLIKRIEVVRAQLHLDGCALLGGHAPRASGLRKVAG